MGGDWECQNEPLWLAGPQKELSKSCQNIGNSLEYVNIITSAFFNWCNTFQNYINSDN